MSKEMHFIIDHNQFQRTHFPHARDIMYITVMKIECVQIQAEFLAGDSKIDPGVLLSQWGRYNHFSRICKNSYMLMQLLSPRKYLYLPHRRDFSLRPPAPSGNSLYFPLNSLAFESPHPPPLPEISNPFCGGGGGGGEIRNYMHPIHQVALTIPLITFDKYNMKKS